MSGAARAVACAALALLLLLGSTVPASAAPHGGPRRLLAKPDGKQPWKNAPPANMTVIIHFNQLAQLAIRSTSTGLQLGSKFMALVALAQRTAVQRFARPDVQVAAAAYAGHGVLTRFFPLQSATFDAVMRGYTAGLTAAQRATVAARAANIAQRIVAQSLTDGLSSWADWYFPPNGSEPAGVYRFTSPTQTFSLLPQLSHTRPLIIPGPEQFERGGPLDINGTAFAAELEEVKQVGGVGYQGVTAFTVETAQFWFNGAGTSSSAGQWSDVAASLLPLDTSPYAAADLLYRLNAAMFDASVVCWRSKYGFDFWRPITAIRALAAVGSPDATWAPILAPTPAHPEHPSGHSCAGGAAGRILRNYWGTDNKQFIVGSEWPIWTDPTLPNRQYNSFTEAVEEGMVSRIYAGVHYRRAVNVGRDIGEAVGAYVWSSPGPRPSTVTSSAFALDDTD